MHKTICRHLRITGHVQGVGYRWSLCARAEALGLAGWVCNRRDGSVEALVYGPPEAVEALTGWAHDGPPSAHVEGVVCNELPVADGETLTRFEQRPTR
jgi:acylphosphatase